MMHPTRSMVVAALVSGSLACGGSGGEAPPAKKVDPAVSAQESAQYTGDVVRQLGRSISFSLADDSMLARMFGALAGQGIPGAARVVQSPLPDPVLGRLSGTPALRSVHPALSVMTQEENFDDTAADIAALLEHRILAPGNVEAKTETQVTYLLKGDPTCRPLPSQIAEGAADQVDAGCAADLAKLEVRVVVRGDGDGYRFQILVGAPRHELSVFVVHSDLLGWEADLYQAWQAGDHAKAALGQMRDPLPFGRLQGRIKVAAQKLGPEKASVSFGVLEPLDLQGKADQPFALAVAKSDPLFAFTGDAATQQVSVKLAIPRTDVKGPWDPRDMGLKNTDLHVSLGGLFGETTIAEATEEVTFTGLGVGPSFLDVRSARVFNLAFNASSGNKMDLKIKSLANDGARFEISPRLDLALGFKLDAIAADLDEVPPFLANETYSVLVAGGAPSVLEASDAGFKMVAGSLTLSTSANPAAMVNVPAGQCLVGVEMPADGAHPLLGSFAAGACQ